MTKNESLQYMQEKIKAVRTGMLTTYSPDKRFRSRPIGTADVDDQGNIWFFTDEILQKVTAATVEKTVSLTYSDPKNHTYLSIIGQGSIVDDPDKKRALWNSTLKTYFPYAVEDTSLTLIKIVPFDAEYWDSGVNGMVVLFNVLKGVGVSHAN
jgi:general stress protein 26